MLVLTRKLGERILIQGGITITCLSIEKGKVRIGVEAPPSQKIYREEVMEKLSIEEKEAMLVDPESLPLSFP